MLGKKKCRILREIRQKIADENEIPFVTEECRYRDDCKGTCPKCEAELRYLEQQLEKRRALGKKVTVSALALGLAASMTGCRQVSHVPEGDVPYSETEEELGGAVSPDDAESTTNGAETTEEEEHVLVGDVLYEPESDEESESDYEPESNANVPVYGPPPTETTKKTFSPADNVDANIYGPPSMMESVANNG